MPRALITLLLCIALVGTNGMILSPVLTDIAQQFGVSASVTGRAIAAYGFGTMFTALWLGRSLDNFGVARALRFALVVAGLSQIGSAFSQGWIMLVGFQFVAGMGAGIALPAIYSITGAISPKGHESRYMARVLLGWSVSLVAAVPLGAAISEVVGWRVMLVLTGSLCVALVPLVFTLPAFTVPARTTPKMARFRPLALPGGAALYAICLLFMISFYGLYAYIGDYARQAFSLGSTAAGLIALVYGLGFGLATFFAPLIDKLGRQTALRLGLLLAAGLLACLSLPSTFVALLPLVFFWGWVNHFILNMIVVGLNALAPANRGAVLGLYSATTYLGASIGAILLGLLYEQYGFIGPTFAAAGLHLFAILVTLIKRP
ncbi:MAG: MFS transporter [Rhodobacteraceae bacterium]|nr:MFS transporter [Paracoccaceae bacterium]